MCRQQLAVVATSAWKADHAIKPLNGDEVWAADSDSECESTVSGSGCESDSASSLTRARVLSPNFRTTQPVERPVAGIVPVDGVLDKATCIRLDNDRLRNALVKAHRDAEAAITMPLCSASSGQGVDFAHLLALVKDFGDGLGGLGSDSIEGHVRSMSSGTEGAVGSISISTPRGDIGNEAKDAKVSEAALLRMELAASRREAANIRARLTLRKAEIAAAKVLAAKSC